MTEWGKAANEAMQTLIESGVEFTSDDLTDIVGHPDETHTANGRNSVIGSLFRAASSQGTIQAVGIAKSRKPHRKGNIVRVWRGVNGNG